MKENILRTRRRVRLGFDGDVARTKQSMKAECDINNIMAKFAKTGTVSHLNRFGARYGEVPALTFHEAMNVVRQSEQMFDALPGKVRVKFRNDPGAFLEFVQDPANLPEMRELGLAMPEASTAPSLAPIAAPVSSSAPAAPAGAPVGAGAASTVVT